MKEGMCRIGALIVGFDDGFRSVDIGPYPGKNKLRQQNVLSNLQ